MVEGDEQPLGFWMVLGVAEDDVLGRDAALARLAAVVRVDHAHSRVHAFKMVRG